MRQTHERVMIRLNEVDPAGPGACFGGSIPRGWRRSGPSVLATA